MSEVDLVTLADAGAFVSHEHQSHLADVVRMSDWRIDAAGSTFVYTDGGGVEHAARAHLVGTSSPEDRTWLWGWDNINGFPAAFVKQSRRIRALGERYAIGEFTQRTLPLTDELPPTLLRAVKAVTGVTAHFSAPTGNGSTRAWLLLDDPALALPRPTVVRAVAVVTSALAGSGPVDHRRALTAWAEQRGVRLTDLGHEVVELTLDDGSLQVRFDPSGRIAGLGKRLPSSATTPTAPSGTERTETTRPDAARPEVRRLAVNRPEPSPQPQAAPEPPTATEPIAAVPGDPQQPRRGLLQRLLGH